ncbi:MAG: methyltransferase domain-containing protein [Chthoniobacter sp.]|nr:methyltransferase domain-containing protein [Chthoniobacter sp.]
MASIYVFFQRVWRGLPEGAKQFIRRARLLDCCKRKVAGFVGQFDAHNSIYNDTYYNAMEQHAQRSMEVIAQDVFSQFHPARVLDVGCGTGALLFSLQQRGVDVLGFEYSEAGIAICQKKGVPVRKCNLEKKTVQLPINFDVSVCTEVAEHLPESCADDLVNLLCRAAPVVVFTAAVPGQGGDDHVNEQPHEYWIKKFAEREYDFDQALTSDWRRNWRRAQIVDCFSSNLMIFRKRS